MITMQHRDVLFEERFALLFDLFHLHGFSSVVPGEQIFLVPD